MKIQYLLAILSCFCQLRTECSRPLRLNAQQATNTRYSQRLQGETAWRSSVGRRVSRTDFFKPMAPEFLPNSFPVIDVEPVTDPTALKERKRHKKRRDDFLLNKGRVTDSIREEIPRILDEAPSMELCRDDATLQLQFGSLGMDVEFRGKKKYKAVFDRLRWTARLALGWVEVSPVIIRPDVDPMSPYIRARWSITAYPRLFMQSGIIRVDLLSIMELDGNGYVKRHSITDIEDSSLRIPAVLRQLFIPSPSLMEPALMERVSNMHGHQHT